MDQPSTYNYNMLSCIYLFIFYLLSSASSPVLLYSMGPTIRNLNAFTVHKSFNEIARNYDAFILDQYGVMHNGQQSLPGAVECVEHLSSMGKKLIVLSNTSAPADTALSKLSKLGFDPNCFVGAVTSGEEASRFIREEFDGRFSEGLDKAQTDKGIGKNINKPKKAVLLTWKDDSVSDQFLSKCGNVEATHKFEEADLVIAHGCEVLRKEFDNSSNTSSEKVSNTNNHQSLGTFIDDGDMSIIEPILKQCIERKLPMICANPDFIVKVGKDGTIKNMPGKIAHRYEQMGGKCHRFGKPNEEHFYACLRDLNFQDNPTRVAHVGDSLHHDVAGANAAGISSIFITGGIHSGYFDCSIGEIPNADDLQSLFDSEDSSSLSYASGNGIVPKHVLPQFRF